MTTLLRSADKVQPVAWTPGEPAIAAAPQRDPLISALEREVGELRTALEEASVEAARAVEGARSEGRKEAEAAFTLDESKRLALLQEAIEAAATGIAEKISGLDSLALLLCETALENVLVRPADHRDLLSNAIARQLGGLRREMVLAVHVSAKEFNDEDAFLALQGKLAAYPVNLHRDGAMSAGECRIELRLGHIDLSLPRYWKELKAKLQEAATTAVPV